MAKNQVSENNNWNDEAAEAEAWKLEQRIAKLKNYPGLNYIQLGKYGFLTQSNLEFIDNGRDVFRSWKRSGTDRNNEMTFRASDIVDVEYQINGAPIIYLAI